MSIGINLRLTAFALLSTVFFATQAQITTPDPDQRAKLPDHDKIVNAMAAVKASNVQLPPEWAIMQRQLINVMEQGAPYYLKKFIRTDGSTYGKGPYLFQSIMINQTAEDWLHCTLTQFFHSMPLFTLLSVMSSAVWFIICSSLYSFTRQVWSARFF